MALFFSYALCIFAERLGKARGGYAFFLPLALLFGIWHYGAAESVHAFVETWPVCPPILVFLCFLVAVAATASGDGRKLPIVAVAGGWLVHNYVAQPLFVVPLTLLAYGGLLASCRRLPDEPTGRGGALTAGWRAFPRAHVVAGVILALFILPVLIDALHGSRSNLSHILTHMHREHESPQDVRALARLLSDLWQLRSLRSGLAILRIIYRRRSTGFRGGALASLPVLGGGAVGRAGPVCRLAPLGFERVARLRHCAAATVRVHFLVLRRARDRVYLDVGLGREAGRQHVLFQRLF